MMKKYKYLPILLFFISVLPAALVGTLILKYGVNFPFLDDWVVEPYIYTFFSYFNIPLHDLIGQHNESRPVFPRFIFIGLSYLSKGDKRYEMMVILAIVCITAFNIYRLNRLTIKGSPVKSLLILIILNILIFSPTQYENWLWGVQILVVMPMLCITTAILVSYSQIKPTIKFIICILLATVSTFSYANGMVMWIVIFPVLAFNNWSEFKQNKWLSVSWIFVCVLNLSLYFYNYHKPPQHPGILENVRFIDVVTYFFCFLGSPFAFSKLNAAKIVGICLLLSSIAVCAYLLRYRKDYSLWHSTIGWLSIAFYTILSALITTSGRVGFGVGQAMAPRYTTFSLYLPIALIPIVVIILEHSLKQKNLAKHKRLVTGTSLVLLTILLTLHTNSASIAIDMMADWRRERLEGKACLMFINVVEDEKCLKEKVYPDVKTIEDLGNKINSIGFLNPSAIESKNIQDIQGAITPNSPTYGWFDTLTKTSQNEYQAAGWAVLPDRKEKADVVILTYQNSQNEDTIFALSDTIVTRQDVAKSTNEKAYAIAGWQKSFSANKLPKGKIKINAWAFDTNTGKAFKLNGSHLIQNP